MNYRHSYHAGNFADCFKHALLLLLLDTMARKDKPFLVIDTHAGRGHYDLASSEAEKTGEWRQGIGRLLQARPPALLPYLELVERLTLYPGSPRIIAARLRAGDRLIACELHEDEARALRRELGQRPDAAVQIRDGYAALRAFLPPPERRSLILIDPPFEQPDEFQVLAETLASAWRKFGSGVYAAWYPVKHRAPVRGFFDALKAGPVRDVIAAEFLLRPPLNPARLNGCGLLIVNPPWGFAEQAQPVLTALQAVLGEAGADVSVERLIDE